jgi:peptidoglycan/LPS O-acetylase OafA/YrhL
VFGFSLLSISLALIVAACVSPKNLFGHARVPGAEAIASVTFSLYLSHKMTWHVVRTYWPEWVRVGGLQAFCVYEGAAFLVGALLYLVVERPFLHLRDRIERSLKSELVPLSAPRETACLPLLRDGMP